MNRKTIDRSKRYDRIARRVITMGGFLIIASVIAILFMIAKVALPLFWPGKARLAAARPLPQGVRADGVLAVGADEYRQTGFVLDDQGAFTFFSIGDGKPLERLTAKAPAAGARRIVSAEEQGRLIYALFWDDGSLSVEKVRFTSQHDAETGARRSSQSLEQLKILAATPATTRPGKSIARLGEDGKLTRADLMPDGRLAVTQLLTTTDILGETTTETKHFVLNDDLPGSITALAADQAGRVLCAGKDTGMLLRWKIEDPDKPELTDQVQAAEGSGISALGFVLGDVSLAVGDGRGGLSTWFTVNTGHGPMGGSLRRIHTLEPRGTAVAAIGRAPRNKTILTLDAAGRARLDHMTSERTLAELEAARPLRLAAITERGDGVVALDAGGNFLSWDLHIPHPEVSFKTLFGKVWYENYPEPAWVWQSTASSEDFEPKLSLVPLIFGTLKGTFYALLLAVPLAVLGALYTSQFMRPELRRLVKPAVEIMSAIPSVVIGFLAALWLAPLVERSLVGIILSVALIPACLVLALLAWQWVERLPAARRLGRGYEFLILGPVVLAGGALAFWLGPAVERTFFDGNFIQWLFDDLGVRYDQRNSIIIAFALGFAVIPLIFTIADDSMTNIPRSLTAASLALGASRWQTAWRVVLPSASPGIFAGVMIGLGRAVGETMIVLMATGNTPIIDASPFNGMRTLSANIAVEIPESPVNSTLYRVLFLTAVLLFLMTFALNTAAELVRQRLRKKFGQL